MHVRTPLVVAVSFAALVPAIANAGPESAALKTCTAAFAASFNPSGTAAPSVKLNYRAGQPGSALAEYYTRDYTFFLKANDPKTGLPLARATCSATPGGILLSLSASSKDFDNQPLAAKL